MAKRTCFPLSYQLYKWQQCAPIAQWIEHRIPNPCAQVRFLLGAPFHIPPCSMNSGLFFLLATPINYQNSLFFCGTAKGCIKKQPLCNRPQPAPDRSRQESDPARNHSGIIIKKALAFC